MKKNQFNTDPTNRVYKQKKLTQQIIIDYISKWISPEQLFYLKNCNNFMDLVSDFERKKQKRVFANSCKNRFCPICNFHHSRKNALMLETILRAIYFDLSYDYYFITLTTPNVKSECLEDEIELFNKSISRLFKRKSVNSISKGYIRKLEITYNPDTKTYNPHTHLILAVNKSYSKNAGYLSKKDWLNLWRSVTRKTGLDEKGNDVISQIKVDRVKDKTKAIFEIAKYAAKDFDLAYSEEVFDVFYKSFKGKQQITFNGVFKEYVKKYKNGDLEDFMLKDKTQYYWFIHAVFDFQQKVYKTEYKKLTDEQRKKFKID